MAKQDDFMRITLRIPADLYEQVRRSAATKSINAEILERLSGSFAQGSPSIDDVAIEKIADAIAQRLRRKLSI